MEEEEAQAASLRDLTFAAELAFEAAQEAGPAGQQGPDGPAAAAESALLQLRSLLTVAAAQSAAAAHHADAPLQQCIAQLHVLSVAQSSGEARRTRVAELLKQAGCAEGFQFTSPDSFDLGARLRQSEPHKSLLAGPLPSVRVQPDPALPSAQQQQQQQQGQPAPPGVLAEQRGNQAPPPRRSGFQPPVAKPGAYEVSQHPPASPQDVRAPPPRAASDSRWAAKVPRRAADAHVHQGRRRSSGGDEVAAASSGDDADAEPSGRAIPGFQTAKAKLVADLQRKGQQYNSSQYGGGCGGPPRPGLARPGAGGMRPAGLRKPGGGVGGAFVPPYVRKAIEAQGGERGGSAGEEAEGPLTPRTLEILRLAPGEPLPEPLAKLDPALIENVCSEVMESGGQLDWEDIAGQKRAKDLIQEVVVWPIKNPQLFTGARAPPKGILLFGPPGTGKTMLGKAIATNISAVFFSISASSLVSKWMGEGERLVRALFAVAAHVAPAVIFIDEVDSLLSARKSDGEHESMRRLKTEILVQMEGVDPSRADRRVLLVGATNRPEELDEAARRRMPKQLYIPLPDADARRDLVLRQLGPGGPVASALAPADLDKVVARTAGYSGSDMKALVQEACQGPVRDAFRANGAALAGLTADALRPVVLRDFQMAARAQKASVEPAEIERYERYNERHGAKLSGAGGEEELEDDW